MESETARIAATFHVKHQKRGLFLGVPEGRGYSLSVGVTFSSTSYAVPNRERPWATKPRRCSPCSLHLSSKRSPGGSETIRTPPTLRNLTAHSAVTAGGPKERAVTRSNFPSNSGQRAASSARAMTTSPVSGAPVQVSASLRKLLLLPMESRKTSWQRQRSKRTRPGKPPPLPRSSNSAGGVGRIASQHRAKPSA